MNQMANDLLNMQITQLEMIASLDSRLRRKSISSLKRSVRSILQKAPQQRSSGMGSSWLEEILRPALCPMRSALRPRLNFALDFLIELSHIRANKLPSSIQKQVWRP